jgi:hypothetical protein
LALGSSYAFLVATAFIISSAASLALVMSLAGAGLSRALRRVDPQYFDYVAAAVLALTALYVYLAP